MLIVETFLVESASCIALRAPRSYDVRIKYAFHSGMLSLDSQRYCSDIQVNTEGPRWDGLVVACHMVGRGFAPLLGHNKDPHKMVQTVTLLGTHGLG